MPFAHNMNRMTVHRSTIRRSTTLFLFATMIAVAGCDHGEDITGPGEPGRFARIQEEIFDASCVGCHRGGSSALGGLDLSSEQTAYDNLVNVDAAHPQASGWKRVVPNDPDASFLVHKLEGGPNLIGTRMPLGGSPLSEDKIQLVRDWIADGAPRD